MKKRQPRVLVVNTDPQLRRTIAAVLTAEGFKTTTAEDEPSALLAMATSEFSIVVIEKNLQTLDDGPKIVRQGRLRHPRLKALYLSAYFDSLSGDPDLDSWVPMPFRIGELVGCAWELHCRGRQPSTVIMPLFDVEIGRSVSIQRTAAAPIPTALPLVITVRHRRPSAVRFSAEPAARCGSRCKEGGPGIAPAVGQNLRLPIFIRAASCCGQTVRYMFSSWMWLCNRCENVADTLADLPLLCGCYRAVPAADNLLFSRCFVAEPTAKTCVFS